MLYNILNSLVFIYHKIEAIDINSACKIPSDQRQFSFISLIYVLK